MEMEIDQGEVQAEMILALSVEEQVTGKMSAQREVARIEEVLDQEEVVAAAETVISMIEALQDTMIEIGEIHQETDLHKDLAIDLDREIGDETEIMETMT